MSGPDDKAMREFVKSHPQLTMAEGEVFAVGNQGGTTIGPANVIECPECGGLAWFDKGQTECCGEVSEDGRVATDE